MPAALEAPAAPAAPPQGNNNAPAAPPPGKTNMESAFDALEGKAKPFSAEQPPIPPHPADKKQTPPPKEEKAKEQETPAPDPDDDDEQTTDPEAEKKAQEEAAKLEQERKSKETPPVKKKGDFLREELAKVKSERDNFKKELETLKNSPRGDDPEKKTLQEKLSAMEKRQQEIEDDYRLHKYERSDEYKNKFLKPYQEAYVRGRQKALSLEFTNADGTTRPATEQDFDTFMMIQNDAQAIRYAKEVFGDGYPALVHHRERILEMNAERQKAVEEAKTTGAAKLKEMEEETNKTRETIRSTFTKVTAERESKMEVLKQIEGDQAWNEAIERGKKMADRSYTARDGKTPEEQAEIDAANYVRSRAYSPLKLQNKRLNAQVEELKKELAKYKASEPGSGEGKTKGEVPEPPPANSMDAAFRQIESKGKPATSVKWY